MTANIETERMILVPGTLDLSRAELRGSEALSIALGIACGQAVAVPEGWPPPLNDEDSMSYFLDFFETGGDAAVGWGGWYFLLKRDDGGRGLAAVGNGGFKGLPDYDGTIEVGYSVMEDRHRQGIASEGVGALINRGFADDRVSRIIAHTLTDLTPSIGVLEKLGFSGPFPGPEDGIIRYELDKPE